MPILEINWDSASLINIVFLGNVITEWWCNHFSPPKNTIVRHSGMLLPADRPNMVDGLVLVAAIHTASVDRTHQIILFYNRVLLHLFLTFAFVCLFVFCVFLISS